MSRPSTVSSATAWSVLNRALQRHGSTCDGDDRFIRDDHNDDDELAELCSLCPVFAECREYTYTARPGAGFWAGRRRTYRPRRQAET